ncbi:IS66 family insertion sequence element accessory protein TnpA [Psychrobium sp. nBUS_13]|uniref:IS66 family insertion sequence element accessory protein TnpA n=1 Tax=Psychrobium sp. nBUS_13 TaxID=3395319 RepID=UPI003EBE6076
MSKHRSLEQWQDIINLHQSSGLSVSDFCRDNNISTTAFYATKKKLTEETSSFVKACVTQPLKINTEIAPIVLTVGLAKVCLPQSTSPMYLAQLLKGLHHEDVC